MKAVLMALVAALTAGAVTMATVLLIGGSAQASTRPHLVGQNKPFTHPSTPHHDKSGKGKNGHGKNSKPDPKKKHKQKPPPFHGRAITLQRFRTHHSAATVLNINLHDRSLDLHPVLAGNTVAGDVNTVTELAHQTDAIAGINGSFFDFSTYQLWHGLEIKNHVYTVDGNQRTANLYMTPSGQAHIGPVPYVIQVRWKDSRGGRHHFNAATLNSPYAITRGNFDLVTHDLDSIPLPGGCQVAYMREVDGNKWQVYKMDHDVKFLPRRAENQRALVSCSKTHYLPYAIDGQSLGISIHEPFPITDMISGGAQEVKDGQEYEDPMAQLWTTIPRPMTFVCTSKDGWHVTFGVVDGRAFGVHTGPNHGTNNPKLSKFIVDNLPNCYDAMTFDGGGSTTLYWKHKVQNTPSEGDLRPVPDGLYLYRRKTS